MPGSQGQPLHGGSECTSSRGATSHLCSPGSRLCLGSHSQSCVCMHTYAHAQTHMHTQQSKVHDPKHALTCIVTCIHTCSPTRPETHMLTFSHLCTHMFTHKNPDTHMLNTSHIHIFSIPQILIHICTIHTCSHVHKPCTHTHTYSHTHLREHRCTNIQTYTVTQLLAKLHTLTDDTVTHPKTCKITSTASHMQVYTLEPLPFSRPWACVWFLSETALHPPWRRPQH